jgi:hypothetical protein
MGPQLHPKTPRSVLQGLEIGKKICDFGAVQLELGHRVPGLYAFSERFLKLLDWISLMKRPKRWSLWQRTVPARSDGMTSGAGDLC